MSWICLLLSLALAAPEVVVQSTEQGAVRGRLVSVQTERIALQTDAGPVEFARDDVESIVPVQPVGIVQTAPDVNQWSELELQGGSLVLARQILVQGEDLHCQIAAAATRGPVAAVRCIRLAPRLPQEDEPWRTLSQLELNLDALVVRKGQSLDYVEGVIGDVRSDVVQFTTDGETLEVKLSKLAGLVYHRGRQSPGAAPPATVELLDGSRLQASSLDGDGQELSLVATAGFAAKFDWRQIKRVEFSGGKSVFLSDLEPLEQSWQGYFGGANQPLLAQYYRPRRNVTFSGSPLKLDGREFTKGLTVHSRTTLRYDLDRRFARFRAWAGIDPAAGGQGRLRLVLSGDDKTLWEDSIVAGEPAKPLDIDTAGVKRLTVLVDFGDNLDLGDHLILAQPRLTP